MVTLQGKSVKFNNNLIVSHDGGRLSSDSGFLENEGRMMISLLDYNLVNFLRTICFDSKWRGIQVNTIRLHLFKVAGKLVTTARQMYLKLSSSHVYQREFYAVFRQIQRIRQYI